MPTNKLFVYGTLRSGFDNEHARMLRASGVLLGPAQARGAIFRIGHYPGYKSAQDGLVTGEIYELSDPDATFRVLDEYEGREFERVETELTSGAPAWIYRFVPDAPPGARIESGDFLNP